MNDRYTSIKNKTKVPTYRKMFHINIMRRNFCIN